MAMDIKAVTPRLSISPQITPDDIASIAAAGFTTIIDDRPDGEGAGQPSSDMLAEAAKTRGIAFHYLPVRIGETSPRTAARFADVVADAPGKVLAFCRSGARSTALWQADGATRQQGPAATASTRPSATDAGAGVIGALAGSTVGKAVDGRKLLFLFAIVMVLVGVMMLRRRSNIGDPGAGSCGLSSTGCTV